jgi:hypothetical protein
VAPSASSGVCLVLKVSRAGFYRWLSGADVRAGRQRADAELAERIGEIHRDSDGTYGVPRVTAELREAGVRVNHKRVARIMRTWGIVGLHLRKKVRTTIPDRSATPVPDLLRRDFTAAKPNTRYVGDITYLPVGNGQFLYLATVLDLCSKRLVGWSIADHMRTDLVTDALQAAAAARGGGGLVGAVFHSDNGAQGGFQWSSQHLRSGGGPWRYKEGHRRSRRRSRRAVVGSGRRIGRCVRRCVPPDGQSHLVRWSARSGD